VIHVEDEVRLEEGMAEAAVLPVRLPVPALALTVDHAGVDAKRFTFNLQNTNYYENHFLNAIPNNKLFKQVRL
jgi:hypothetical protein